MCLRSLHRGWQKIRQNFPSNCNLHSKQIIFTKKKNVLIFILKIAIFPSKRNLMFCILTIFFLFQVGEAEYAYAASVAFGRRQPAN